MHESRHSDFPSLHLPLSRKLGLVWSYARERIMRQVHAVAFITGYLALFQTVVLGAPVLEAVQVALGILAVVIGLAFFMEGLFLAIMPLGERCGLRLPARTGLGFVLVFAAVLGITATYAEPAIGFLKEQGAATLPWRAPLLYYLLNTGAPLTVGAVALGVGLAVLLGVVRFLKAWSIKPFLFLTIPSLLALSWWASRDPRTAAIIGLAWDSGGVTTGPVTVPLVIALGIGVSRIAGRGDEPSGGLGVVTFASAFPVMAVLLLTLLLAPTFPMPGEAEDFFSYANREQALRVMGSPEALNELTARTQKTSAPHEGLDGVAVSIAGIDHAPILHRPRPDWKTYAKGALKAILPLALVLLIALLVVVRERVPQADEVALGLVFSLIGMSLFSFGMDHGLSSLGNQAGRALPRAWVATERPDKAVLYRGIDESLLVRGIHPDGTSAEFLTTASAQGPVFVPFVRDRYDAAAGEYEWIPEQPPVAGEEVFWGYALVLFFVFAMGVGATVAEPSLNALGVTLEELTTGTYRRSFLVLTVSIGVGVGMVAGFARILLAWPLMPLLLTAYTLALALTVFSSEEITAIAWDCAGVTTGPITVPLVIAAGLGIGQRAGVAEAFGVVTMASACPVIAVLLSGFILAARQERLDRNTALENPPGPVFAQGEEPS